MWILELKGLTMCRRSSDKSRWSDDIQGMVMQERESLVSLLVCTTVLIV